MTYVVVVVNEVRVLKLFSVCIADSVAFRVQRHKSSLARCLCSMCAVLMVFGNQTWKTMLTDWCHFQHALVCH